MDYTPFYNIGIALGLGLLVGLQREKSDSQFGGIRTFPLITMAGLIAGYLAQSFESDWIIAAGMLTMGFFTFASNYVRTDKVNQKEDASGQTTEVAAFIMFLIGAYIVSGDKTVAVVVTAIVTILLHLKPNLHAMVDKFGEKDVKAIMQFVVIALVVLPLLPNEDFGPYDAINPREIWLMVSLIVGISVAGYFIYKWKGESAGTIAGGLLGGLISSTATTVSYSRQTKDAPKLGILAAMVIMIASTVSFVRILIEVGLVVPAFLGKIAPPVVALILIMAVICFFLYRINREKEDSSSIPEPKNPAQLTTALFFGGLYLVIILAVAFAKDFFGNSGLYIVSVISGFTDVDAITLSLSNTIKSGGLDEEQGWKLIMIAGLSNMLFKAGLAVGLGSKRLGMYVLVATAVTIVSGLIMVFLWPAGWQF